MVRQPGAEYAAKGFSSWNPFVDMLSRQLGRAHSLREIEGGLKSCEGKLAHLGIEAPARAYANAHPPWQLFEQVFYGLYEKVAGSAAGWPAACQRDAHCDLTVVLLAEHAAVGLIVAK